MQKFDALEEKIGHLLKLCASLEADKAALREVLGRKDTERAELRDRVKKYEKEKGAVREKVEGLLSRLDGLIQNV
ncbi:MAG: cell division protein ZapB [Deltaproteobacteria bacterium]|nr:cell division protein ZapB [Deltaproteobacteria bacterium]